MTNAYFNHENPLDRHTLGRAELVNAIFEAIVAGFDKLPNPDLLSQASQTYADDTGAANAYVVSLPTAPQSYDAGLTITMRAANANTGASTINVDGLGAKTIKRYNGDPLIAGDILVGQLVVLGYDGTDFRLVGVHGGEVELARQWATSLTTVGSGLKGSRGYAQDAGASANAAKDSEDAALISEQNTEGLYTDFRERYYGQYASDPATDPFGNPPQNGAQYYNTTAKELRIYDEDDDTWSAIGMGTLQTFVFTAAGGETSLSGLDDNNRALNYSPGFELVYLNGVRLVPGDDYVASNGSTITGLTALSPGDVLTMDAFTRFTLTEERLALVNNIAALRLKSGGPAFDTIWLKCHTTAGDGGHGEFRWEGGAAPGTYVDNNGTIIVPTGGDGSAAWLREITDFVSVKWFGARGDWNETAKTGTDDRAAINAAAAYANMVGIRDVVFPTAKYRTQSFPVYIYSNQRWLLSGSTIRKYGAREGGLSSDVIQSRNFGADSICKAEICNGIIWGDGEELGKAPNSNQCAGISLWDAAGCVLQNIEAKHSGGDNISVYGKVDGEHNVLRNIVSGPGWGQNAISVVSGTIIWDNVKTTGAGYVGADPGLHIDIESDTGQTSKHFMQNVVAANCTFADLLTPENGNYSHEIWMQNCEFGPAYAPLEIISANNTIAKNIYIGNNVVCKTSASANARAVYLAKVSNVRISGAVLDTSPTADPGYGMLIIGTVDSCWFDSITFKDKRPTTFGIIANGANDKITNSLISNCDIGNVFLGQGGCSGNRFKNSRITTLSLRGIGTTSNEFDEATTVNAIAKISDGHISGQRMRSRRGSIVVTYDFSVNGGAVSTIELGEPFPANSRVTRGSYEVITAPTSSGSAQIAIGTHSNGQNLKAFTAYNNATFNVGVHDFIPDGSAATFTGKTTSRRGIFFAISGAALTGGRIVMLLDYVVTDS